MTARLPSRFRAALASGDRIVLFALAYAASAVMQKGLGFLLFMYFAHSLRVEDYARFGLLYSLQAAVVALAMAGIIETTIGGLKHARTPESSARLLRAARMVQGVSACGSMIVVPLCFAWSNAFGWKALAAAAIGGALTSFFTLQSQLARIVERHWTALLLGSVPPLLALAGGLAGFLVSRDSLGFFLGYAAALVITLPLSWTARIEGGSSAVGPDMAFIARRIGPFLLIAITDWFVGYGNTYLVKVFFSSEAVARFVFAYTLSSILALVATSMNQAWSPRVFRFIHDLPVAEVEQHNRGFYRLQGAVLGMTGAIVLVAMSFATRWIAGGLAAYQHLQLELLLLFAGYVVLIPWYHAQNFYYAHASGPLLMRISIGTSIVGIALWVAAAAAFGPLGAYFGFFLMMLCKSGAALFWARRAWGTHVLWQGPVIGIALLAGGGAATMLIGG